MKKIVLIVLFSTSLTSLSTFADCTQGKRSIQELLYEEKNDLISAHCINDARGTASYNYMMGLLKLGDMYSNEYKTAEKEWEDCTAENKLIVKILKKDHGHEFKTESDCSQEVQDLLQKLEKK